MTAAVVQSTDHCSSVPEVEIVPRIQVLCIYELDLLQSILLALFSRAFKLWYNKHVNIPEKGYHALLLSLMLQTLKRSISLLVLEDVRFGSILLLGPGGAARLERQVFYSILQLCISQN
jgi:hypothetical protein